MTTGNSECNENFGGIILLSPVYDFKGTEAPH